MTKDKALYQFFSHVAHKRKVVGGTVQTTAEFIPAYPDTAVLNENGKPDVVLPYLTYTPIFDAWDGEPVSLTVNLWERTESEAIPNAEVQEISEAIGLGGKMLKCDEGYIWLKRGSPWCQNLSDETDPAIKRRYINVTAEYLTDN